MLIKTFWWTLGGVLLALICAFFLTEDLTSKCSDKLSICLMQHTHLPLWDKMMGGVACVLNNVWCVLTRPFI